MAVIDRDVSSLTTEELERLAHLDRATPPTGSPAPAPPWSAPMRVLLAALSASAGVIHLVMVPSHARGWLVEGLAFAAVGWAQIALAVVVLVRPSRPAVRASCLINLAFIVAWLVTRIWGSPLGPEAGVPLTASFVDLTCVALEALLVVAGYELLATPTLGARLRATTQAVLSIVPAGILALTTAAIASPSATDHRHASSTGAEVAAAAPAQGSPAAPMPEAAAASGHDHGPGQVAPADDKGLSLIMNGAGEGGGHVHSNEVLPVDPATQAQLDAQLAQLQPLIDRFPTVQDAEAAGYRRQGPYSPALGAHYARRGAPHLNAGPAMKDEDLQNGMLIYDGVAPGSKLAGFMFNIFSLDTENPPEGFAGPNDHWHFHTNVCIKMNPDGSIDAPLGADTTAEKSLCDQLGGFLIANTGYMVHVWPVKGYESPQGLFSNLNSKLTCPNGTYYIVPQDQIGSRTNVCKDVPAS